MRQIRSILILVVILAIVFVASSGSFLMIDNPAKADAIVVLAGETDVRPKFAIDMLRQGYSPRLLLDVPVAEKIYIWPETELADKYLKSLPEAPAMQVCPVYGLSTKAETQDVARCLRGQQAKTILLVTSDYHTRRALMIFRHELPQYGFSVAGATNARTFGTDWWQEREWAKTNFDEWTKLAWWTLVDRWR